ncbi:hypothetical protein B0T26DRAFT_811572 [Lasiosphaeria miniovina]|uniref:Uncharacterized protein n=1 Tax=Lasiosphaeria miniovina TaxID=1954250 RepID=A0AA40E597_9PEZI|nr:uncharacterized protein B0T26DRAFT_811572 [Lasiosphaeria miniovina]KAK0722988.1 hypothetical protein B0T26DRAFT_811572 [Lasiosphaeria miniovina]
MFFPKAIASLSWAGMLLTLCSASPVEVIAVKRPQHDLMFREALELAHRPRLDKRLEADFSMEKAWNNEVLFAGSWVNSDAAIGITDTVSLSVVCVDCWTKGTVTAKLLEDLFDPSVRLEFSAVEAYVDVAVAVTSGATYSVNLFTSNSPVGLGFPGFSIGLVFYVDLVFSLTAAVDLEGGFYVKVADGAFLEASVFGGEITKSSFDGLSSKSLPVTVRAGSATFKADLRLRVQCGAETDIAVFGIGAGAELGIYANLIEFVAVLESTPTCLLQSREWWDLNVGAFAHLDIVVDYKTIGAIPTCWVARSAAQSGSPPSVSVSLGVPSGIPASSAASSSREDGASTSGSTAVHVPTIAPSAPATLPSSLSLLTPSVVPGSVPSNSGSGSGSGDVVTSTVCAATVPNCPASLQSEIIVTKTAAVVDSASTPTTIITPAAQGTATVVVITDVTVLVPCATPVVETFIPPSSCATSVVSQKVTVEAAAVVVTPAASSSSSAAAGAALYYSAFSSAAATATAPAPPPPVAPWYRPNNGTSAVSNTTTPAPIPTAGASSQTWRIGSVLFAAAAVVGALSMPL